MFTVSLLEIILGKAGILLQRIFYPWKKIKWQQDSNYGPIHSQPSMLAIGQLGIPFLLIKLFRGTLQTTQLT